MNKKLIYKIVSVILLLIYFIVEICYTYKMLNTSSVLFIIIASTIKFSFFMIINKIIKSEYAPKSPMIFALCALPMISVILFAVTVFLPLWEGNEALTTKKRIDEYKKIKSVINYIINSEKNNTICFKDKSFFIEYVEDKKDIISSIYFNIFAYSNTNILHEYIQSIYENRDNQELKDLFLNFVDIVYSIINTDGGEFSEQEEISDKIFEILSIYHQKTQKYIMLKTKEQERIKERKREQYNKVVKTKLDEFIEILKEDE